MRRAPLAVLVLLAATGCLYIPPFSRTSGFHDLADIEAGRTRAEVRDLLPETFVLRTHETWIVAWTQNYGFIILGGPYSAAVGEIPGPAFATLLSFEGDVVGRCERHSSKPAKDGAWPAVEPVEVPVLLAEMPEVPGADGCHVTDATGTRCLLAYGPGGRTWVAADGPERGAVDLPWRPPAAWRAAGGRVLVPRGTPVDVSADGRLAVLDRLGELAVVDVPGRRVVFHAKKSASGVLSRDGRWFGFLQRGNAVIVETSGWTEVLRRPRKAGPGWQVAFASAAPRAALLESSGGVTVVDLPSGITVAAIGRGKARRWFGGAALSPDGRRLALATWAALEIWDVEALARDAADAGVPRTFTDDAPASALLAVQLLPFAREGQAMAAYSDDGSRLVALSGARALLVTGEGEPIGRYELPRATAGDPAGLRLGPGSRLQWSGTGRRAELPGPD